MKLTRYIIKKQIKLITKYINKEKKLGKRSIIYKSTSDLCRKSPIKIDYSRDILNNIYFIYDPIEKHWGETDGKSIGLNTYKEFNSDTLYYTILHEYLHGMIYRNNTYMSEYLEHRVMLLIDKNLI
jgi:hypothetical protein